MSITAFRIRKLKGAHYKNIIMMLFEEAGYDVYPFGYESSMGSLRNLFSRIDNNDNILQLRYMPDLFVTNRDNRRASCFVEVKKRNRTANNCTIDYDKLERYQKFWGSAMFVIISKDGIYAQKFKDVWIPEKLKIDNDGRRYFHIDLTKKFKPINKVFTKIDEKLLDNVIRMVKGTKFGEK